MKKLIVVLPLILAGCATSNELYLPSGAKGYTINCDGMGNSVSSCFERASELCGARGYSLINKEGESNAMGYGFGTINANANSANGVSVSQYGAYVSRSMLIRCNEASK